jgi:hypothetical protein
MPSGFPMVRKMDPATSAQINGTVTSGSGQTLFGPFVPEVGRVVYMKAKGAAAPGSVQLLRSADGGVTKLPITVVGNQLYLYNASNTTGTIVNEDVDCPESGSLTYYLLINLSSGSVTYSLYQ